MVDVRKLLQVLQWLFDGPCARLVLHVEQDGLVDAVAGAAECGMRRIDVHEHDVLVVVAALEVQSHLLLFGYLEQSSHLVDHLVCQHIFAHIIIWMYNLRRKKKKNVQNKVPNRVWFVDSSRPPWTCWR